MERYSTEINSISLQVTVLIRERGFDQIVETSTDRRGCHLVLDCDS